MSMVVAAMLLAIIGSGCRSSHASSERLPTASTTSDPLPSWNDGESKERIIDFVARVSNRTSPDFVPPAERIAVFDNDGTLWSEQPYYPQLAFAFDRIRALAPEHPEWKSTQPFQGILEGDVKAALAVGEQAALALLEATHAGMTTEDFEAIVAEWIDNARHPRFDLPYTDLVYQPMLELIALLKANDFRVYVVSGGGISFMRPWVEQTYGLPRSNVVGSSIRTSFEMRGGKPALVRLPQIDFIDDGPGKPIAIDRFIGRRPIAAFGNSDGDLQMLQWTASGPRAGLAVLVRHTDAKREWQYDRDSRVGTLNEALDVARADGWTVVDMRRDWRRIFRFEDGNTNVSSPFKGGEGR